jgi:hypothetical protein
MRFTIVEKVSPTGPDRQTKRDQGIQVLRRAAAALDEIAAEPGRLRLVDLSARLGLAKSTARRLLVGLVEVGLASVDSRGRFSLGERFDEDAGSVPATAHVRVPAPDDVEAVGFVAAPTVAVDRERGLMSGVAGQFGMPK